MAITFRGAASGSVNNGGTLSITLSGIAGLAQNDVVVCGVASSSGTNATPSGWTLATEGTNLVDVYYKVMTATPDTSVSFWDTGTNTHAGAGVALAFTGVDTSDVLDATPPALVVAADTTPANPAAITPDNNNAAILVYCFQVINGVADTTMGDITNYTTSSSVLGNDDFDVVASAWYRILSGGGGASEDPGTPGSWSPAINSANYAHTIALRESVGGQPIAKRLGGVTFGHARAPFRLWRDLLIPNRGLVYG